MRIGFTCGTFDLFHSGHVTMLREAKMVCDHLIVGIQTDPTIDRPDKNSPVQSIIERQIQVSSCKYVDEIIVYTTENELFTILKTLPIDVRIVGEEYRDKDFTGKDLITVHYNKRAHSYSSTDLRTRVYCKEKEKRDKSVIKMEN